MVSVQPRVGHLESFPVGDAPAHGYDADGAVGDQLGEFVELVPVLRPHCSSTSAFLIWSIARHLARGSVVSFGVTTWKRV